MRNRLLAAGAGVFVALVLVVAGCQPQDKTTPAAKDGYTTKTGDQDGPPAKAAAKKGKHDGWWCKEHGIPEHECLVCLHTEEELKQKGDWCEKHEFAKSQCFKCDPKLKEKYAAKYRAKYGEEPPPIPDAEDETKDDKKEPEKKAGEGKDAGKKEADKDGKK